MVCFSVIEQTSNMTHRNSKWKFVSSFVRNLLFLRFALFFLLELYRSVYTISNHPLKRHQRSLHKVKKSSNLNNNFLRGLLRSLFLFILCLLFVRRFFFFFCWGVDVTWLYYAVCAGCVCPLKQLMLTCIVDDVAIVDALSIHYFCDRVFYCCRRYSCCCCYFFHCNG